MIKKKKQNAKEKKDHKANTRKKNIKKQKYYS